MGVRMAADQLTGVERKFGDDEIIVSKTDLKGRLTYCNDVFIRLAGYAERDLIGKPHSLIRHPHMPRAVFKLLWSRIEAGREIFAYVINRSANGDHYWVLAHVSPDRGADGSIIGFHSNRRTASPGALAVIEPLYKQLRKAEDADPDRKAGLAQSSSMLDAVLAEQGVDYDRFVLGL
jgi:PAS domain S-box-containing protein